MRYAATEPAPNDEAIQLGYTRPVSPRPRLRGAGARQDMLAPDIRAPRLRYPKGALYNLQNEQAT